MPLAPKVAITALNDQPTPHAQKADTIALNAQATIAIDLQLANVQPITHPLGLNAPTTIENLPQSAGLLLIIGQNVLLAMAKNLLMPQGQTVLLTPLELKADTIALNAQAIIAIDLQLATVLHTLQEQTVPPMLHAQKAVTIGQNAQALTNQKVGHFLLIDQPTSQEPKAVVPRLNVERNLPLGMNAVVHLETVPLQKIVKEIAKAVRL
jgi:hypothetical protein